MKSIFLTSLMSLCIIAAITSCDRSPEQISDTPAATNKNDTTQNSGLRIAFIYGDSINAKYNFLIDAEENLEREGKQMDERLRRKLSRAEARARELQGQAATMTQMQMQEAQLELQNLDLEMQQFQETLAGDIRKMEIDLQKDYVGRVDSFLEAYNSDGKYDMIMNFQRGGNLLWINKAFDITDEVLKGLNDAYDARVKPSESESKK